VLFVSFVVEEWNLLERQDMVELETARLRLRAFRINDFEELYPIFSDPEVMKYVGKGARNREETLTSLRLMINHWEEHGFGMWALLDKLNGGLVGRCGLIYLDGTPEIELGYTLAKHCWGRGLATEAARASLDYGFQRFGLERIVAIAHPDNQASRRVMEKVGMKYEKDARYYETDVVYYAVHRKEYTC
jgi:RimJ/RimL family protein N-acetyltransferase